MNVLFIQCVFTLQGRDILEQLKALPKRNVSVRAVSSIPSVTRNSTDLDILREHGHDSCIHMWLCIESVMRR